MIYNFLGALAEAKNNFFDAKRFYNKSISLDNSYYEPVFNLTFIQLYENNFIEGWKNFESRWKNNYYKQRKLQTNKPFWTPMIESKGQITIWPEQGMGDFILFSRFLSDLLIYSKKITVLVYDKLANI